MGFDTVKPTALMKKLLSYMGDNYTVLDFSLEQQRQQMLAFSLTRLPRVRENLLWYKSMKSAKWEQMRTLLDIPTSAKLVKNASVELLKSSNRKFRCKF